MLMMNADQRRIFEHVKEHLLNQQQHEANQCHCDLTLLRKFINGVVKSFLIKATKALVTSMWLLDGLTCAIVAPPGFNIGSVTGFSNCLSSTRVKPLAIGCFLRKIK